jgi:hypothetical protein
MQVGHAYRLSSRVLHVKTKSHLILMYTCLIIYCMTSK